MEPLLSTVADLNYQSKSQYGDSLPLTRGSLGKGTLREELSQHLPQDRAPLLSSEEEKQCEIPLFKL